MFLTKRHSILAKRVSISRVTPSGFMFGSPSLCWLCDPGHVIYFSKPPLQNVLNCSDGFTGRL